MPDNGLLVSLVDLPAALGERVQLTLNWVVPDQWATEMLKLEPGTTVPIDVTLTSVDGGVLVELRAEGDLRGQCVRCLDDIEVPWVVDTADIYVDQTQKQALRRSVADSDIEVEGDEIDQLLVIENDQVDIEPMLRDAIFAAAPFQPLCDENCLGLCGHCGIRLADAEPGHSHDFFDPRFAALEGFFAEPTPEAETK